MYAGLVARAIKINIST